MKLLKFRIKDFRAVTDSGWIDCGQITAFVGFNEAGKTTLFAALLRLADTKYQFRHLGTKENQQSPTKKSKGLFEDMPLDRIEELLPHTDRLIFIEAVFAPDEETHNLIHKRFRNYKPVEEFHIIKSYGGGYGMPGLFDQFETEEDKRELMLLVLSRLPSFMYFKEVTEIKSEIDLVALAHNLAAGKTTKQLSQRETVYANLLSYLDIWQSNLLKSIQEMYGSFEDIKKEGREIDFREVFKKTPLFQDRFTRGFENLTTEFVRWWGAAGMNIYYEPYERGIRIRLTDERGENFLLENRSTGFRRFFALFLAFSVSAKEDFENAILLFDEAGAALHPKMQRKLIAFFSELGKNSQIMYNTHTAYMLPVKDMNRVRIAYKDKAGHISVTRDMHTEEESPKEESLFVAEASLAMYLAQTALVGCLPIAVLGGDDMYYLQVIRNVLIARGKLDTVHETLIFSAGDGGIDATTQLFSADNALPVTLLPSTELDKKIKERLIKGTYSAEKEKVFEISQFFDGVKEFVELIPPSFIKIFGGDYLRELLGEEFEYKPKLPLYSQIEQYARDHEIELPVKYRTYLAKSIKINTMIRYENKMRINRKLVKAWRKMFKTIVTMHER